MSSCDFLTVPLKQSSAYMPVCMHVFACVHVYVCVCNAQTRALTAWSMCHGVFEFSKNFPHVICIFTSFLLSLPCSSKHHLGVTVAHQLRTVLGRLTILSVYA